MTGLLQHNITTGPRDPLQNTPVTVPTHPTHLPHPLHVLARLWAVAVRRSPWMRGSLRRCPSARRWRGRREWQDVRRGDQVVR